MKIIIYCYTPFQCITALAIKYKFYSNERVDIIIEDSIQNRKIIGENILINNLFSKVYYSNKTRFFPKNKNRLRHELSRIYSYFMKYYLANDLKLEEKYDIFITTEINCYTESIYSKLLQLNSNLKVELMDEGYSSYTYYFKEAYLPTTLKEKIKKFPYKILKLFNKRKLIAEETNKLYLFEPELLCWEECPYKVVKISVDTENNKEILNQVNKMFGITEEKIKRILQEFNTKFIFFEESFYWSIKNSKDIEIINFIAKIIGKNNIIIKLHPRNLENRFIQLGYKTSNFSEYPWEIIAFNLSYNHNKDKVFITYSSGAALSYKFLCDKNFKTIFLYNCHEGEYYIVNPLVVKWHKKFRKKYGKDILIPKTKAELIKILKKLMVKND